MTATSSVHTRYKRLTPIQRLPYRHLRVLNVIGYLRDTWELTYMVDWFSEWTIPLLLTLLMTLVFRGGPNTTIVRYITFGTLHNTGRFYHFTSTLYINVLTYTQKPWINPRSANGRGTCYTTNFCFVIPLTPRFLCLLVLQ